MFNLHVMLLSKATLKTASAANTYAGDNPCNVSGLNTVSWTYAIASDAAWKIRIQGKLGAGAFSDLATGLLPSSLSWGHTLTNLYDNGGGSAQNWTYRVFLEDVSGNQAVGSSKDTSTVNRTMSTCLP